MTKRLVYGVGINDLDGPVYINRKSLKFYAVWHSMLCRCYSDKFQARSPTYRGCSVCDEWLLLSNFKVWFDANYRTSMELDKDALVKGNKIYCPEACRFVPSYINNLLCDSGAARGDLPIGVNAMKPNSRTGKINTTYRCCCSDGHGRQLAKTFKTVAEARQWYITTKTGIVNEQATRALEAGDIASDVCQALISREW